MATIADAVFDAALSYISTNVNRVQLRNASSAVLVNHVSSGSDIVFGAPANNSGSGGGRKMAALSGGLSSIGVSSTGTITKGALLASSTVVITMSAASSYAVTSADTVNLQAFSIILKDPT